MKIKILGHNLSAPLVLSQSSWCVHCVCVHVCVLCVSALRVCIVCVCFVCVLCVCIVCVLCVSVLCVHMCVCSQISFPTWICRSSSLAIFPRACNNFSEHVGANR